MRRSAFARPGASVASLAGPAAFVPPAPALASTGILAPAPAPPTHAPQQPTRLFAGPARPASSFVAPVAASVKPSLGSSSSSASASSSAAATASGDTPPSALECFAVLYTKKGPKKRKVFADGVITISEGKMALLDMDGKPVSQMRYRPGQFAKLGEGSEFELSSFQVEVGGPISSADYLSGRVFGHGSKKENLGGAVPLPSFPAPSTSNVLKSPLPSAPPVTTSAGTVNPLNTKAPLALPSQQRLPAHDPGAANALVLCRGIEAQGTVDIVVDPGLTQHLRPHQREGVRFMFECVSGMRRNRYSGRGCILADAMGLGKTLQTIALIWTLLKQGARGRGGLPLARKAVVVCPASLVGNWSREVAKWLGPAKLSPITVDEAGESATRKVTLFSVSKVHALLIISYETFRKHADVINKTEGFELMVCDEGHRLKSAAGNKTIKALNAAPTQRRVLLTGTPLQNNLDELYAVVSFVNPQALGKDPTHFKRVFATPIERGRDKGCSKQEKLLADERARELARLTSGFILRRSEEVNRAFLPPKRETSVFCRLSPEQIALYREFLDECAPSLEEVHGAAGCGSGSGAVAGTDALKLIMQLRQLCTHPALLKQQHQVSGINWIASSGKLVVLDSLLRHVKGENGRVVLVSCFTTTLDLLQRLCDLRGYSTSRLDGSTPIEQRQSLVNRFNAEGGSFVFLLSSKAGGCGINLVGANRLILVDGDWNPATDAQALARVWRDGQTKPVIVYRLLATGTIEERVLQRQIMKTETSRGVLDGETAGTHGSDVKFTRSDLKRLFALREDTSCDTFDLLGESRHKEWPEYHGPEDIVGDEALQQTAKAVGGVLTWVSSSVSEFAPPIVEETVGQLELDDGEDDVSAAAAAAAVPSAKRQRVVGRTVPRREADALESSTSGESSETEGEDEEEDGSGNDDELVFEKHDVACGTTNCAVVGRDDGGE